MCAFFQEEVPRTDWESLPFHLLDLFRETFEQNALEADARILRSRESFVRRARLVNHHWCKWATGATRYLKPGSTFAVKTPMIFWVDGLTTKFTNVRHLDLSSCMGITNDVLDKVTALPCLENLELGHCRQITDIGLMYFENVAPPQTD